MATPETPWLLDTSILVDLLRGSKPARDWIDSLSESVRLISVITAAELLAGCALALNSARSNVKLIFTKSFGYPRMLLKLH